MTLDSFKKIIIRTPNWLGDLIMSTAFLQAALDSFPQAKIDLIVKKGFEEIPLPHRGKIIAFDKFKTSTFNFSKQLRLENYDCFYILPPSFSSAWMAYWSNIPVRIGYAGECRRWLLNRLKNYCQKPRSQHLVQEYLDLLDKNFSIDSYQPNLLIDNERTQKLLKNKFNVLGINQPYICIAPGVLYGPAKQWPVEYYKKLIEYLVKDHYHIILLGAKTDMEICQQLEGSKHVLNLCGKTDLLQLIAVLEQSNLLISNDSGIMHVMSALQKQQIAIFGSTSLTWTRPLNQNAFIFYRQLDCSPCFKKKCALKHYQCLYQILPEEVFTKAKEMF